LACEPTNKSGFSFAFISDTHISNRNSANDLSATVRDINQHPDIDFVVVTGDVTEMGSDSELLAAKLLLDSLKKPYYVIPGNHDTKWSESGNESFKRIFGSERFAFEHKGFLFLGCNSGPNMRMAPGMVPREDIVWLDSIVKTQPNQPVIFMNHYPLDKGLANWYEVIDLLKQMNTQAVLCGHGHRNKIYDFEGIPGVMGRSNLSTSRDTCGFNIVSIRKDTMCFNERLAGLKKTKNSWHNIPLRKHDFIRDSSHFERPSYAINQTFSQQVSEEWQWQDDSDIGAGLAVIDDILILANTNGEIKSLHTKDASLVWHYKTEGKIYSTPVIDSLSERVVVASTDGNIYALDITHGKKIWQYETEKSIVASPVISGDTVFIGSSEGIFRAISLTGGQLIWQYNNIDGFVETKPLVDEQRVYFGSWGNYFYALNKRDGSLAWRWTNGKSNLYSPAACFPVKADGKIFIVAPDRFTTALDAVTGQEVWRSNQHIGRESIGISEDKKLVYIKDMNDSLHAFNSQSDLLERSWYVHCGFGYEISPSPIVEFNQLVFVPTHAGTVYAVDKNQKKLAWAFKMSNALINNIIPLGKDKILMSSMDGKVVKLRIEGQKLYNLNNLSKSGNAPKSG